MAVKLHNDFIGDLVKVGDADLAGRALRKCFDAGGHFIEKAQEDHRYDGISGGWIRKVSKGMRVIYIRDGGNVTLYRAGQHSVEDNLRAPPLVEGVLVDNGRIQQAMEGGLGQQRREYARIADDYDLSDADDKEEGSRRGSRLLYNHVDRFLYGNLLGRRFLPHKDVYLVSPFLSQGLLRSTHKFGQMLDELIEGGATVWLVTKPPVSVEDLAPFNELEARGLNIFFNAAVHAKVYAFVLNRDLLKPNQRSSTDFIALGSANLTYSGINPSGLLNKSFQYEISYQAHSEDWAQIERFILHVTDLGTELRVVRANLMGQKR